MSNPFIIECLDCGHQAPYHAGLPACPNCQSLWREARYDYAALSSTLLAQIAERPFNLWRYCELLPVQSPNPDISLGEGGTPLIRAINLGMMLGSATIFIKDERQSPTGSFKDRQAAVTVAALKEAGVNEFVIASTGNVAISYSAYSARAGIKLWAFLTSLTPAAKMREVAIYGSQVIKITGSYDQAKQVAAEYARHRGLSQDQGARTISAIESMKTIAFEIAEQLTQQFGPPGPIPDQPAAPLRAPDWYVQSVSGGMGPIGVLKGFDELKKMGLIHNIPKIAAIQAEGCAPMAHAWKQDRASAQAILSPRTLIATLATGDPGRTYSLLRQKMLAASGGVIEYVSDEEAFRAMHYAAKMEGISIEPATGVAFAGLVKLVRTGVIKPDETVVVNCSGHTIPVERNILGEGWSRDITIPGQGAQEENEEGLLAALSKVSIDRFPRVLIVDDNPEVRRLVRRILQTQGNYTLFDAANGREALDQLERERPNLVILDLAMPEMDGFQVLDEMRKSPRTAEIPVIVVTAKELTGDEKSRLRGRIQKLMQKGDFMSDELLDEVKILLR